MTHRRSPRSSRRLTVAWLVLLAVSGSMMSLQSAPQDRPATSFRSITNLVRVDVVVRDRNGDVVRGLTQDDFILAEDGRVQQITSFDFEEIATVPAPVASPAPAVLGLEQLQSAAARASMSAAAAGTDAGATVDLSGRRLVILLFDISSMQPEEIDRAVKAAVRSWTSR
jgi:VWFA-related protein